MLSINTDVKMVTTSLIHSLYVSLVRSCCELGPPPPRKWKGTECEWLIESGTAEEADGADGADGARKRVCAVQFSNCERMREEYRKSTLRERKVNCVCLEQQSSLLMCFLFEWHCFYVP